jgi:hypothetical protein
MHYGMTRPTSQGRYVRYNPRALRCAECNNILRGIDKAFAKDQLRERPGHRPLCKACYDLHALERYEGRYDPEVEARFSADEQLFSYNPHACPTEGPCEPGSHGRFARTLYVGTDGRVHGPGQTDQARSPLTHGRSVDGDPVVNIGNWPYQRQFTKAAIKAKRHKRSRFPARASDMTPGYRAAIRQGVSDAQRRAAGGWANNPHEDLYDVETSASCGVCMGHEEKRCFCGSHPCRHHPHTRKNPQTKWGAGGGHYGQDEYHPGGGYYEGGQYYPGGGHYDSGEFHPGGGRYLDPRYLGSPYEYHRGGGQVSHGFHPGSGYYANPLAPNYDRCDVCEREMGPMEDGWTCRSCLGRREDLEEWRRERHQGSTSAFARKKPKKRRPRRNPLFTPGAVSYGYGHLPYFAPPGPGLIAPLANPYRMNPRGGLAIQSVLDAAYAHGAESDPDHEVGDLQSALRAAWRYMSTSQKNEFLQDDDVVEVLSWG